MKPVETHNRLILDVGSPQAYWHETLRPFCNLIFLLPFLAIYEFGIWSLGDYRGAAMRNGADAWLRLWLGHASTRLIWLPPVLLMGTLLTWHLLARQPWKMKWDTLGGMAAESLMYAVVLILVGQAADYGFRLSGWTKLDVADRPMHSGLLIRMVNFMGAGIYEEFLFRLCLLPIVYASFRAMMAPKRLAIIGTVVVTSLIFSLAHYLSPRDGGHALTVLSDAMTRVLSKPELWFGFAFRTLAGIFFAALCFFRGFGITVGAHATYDIVVGMILISEI
jgi:membrane protease YdiL (CAAX protease family)